MSSRLSQRLLLGRLVGAEVDFVLVGGLAVAAHGFVRATEDVDLVYATTSTSCERFASALADLGAEVAFADSPEPDSGITGEWLAAGGHFRFSTDGGPLDALSAVHGLDYEELASRAVGSSLGDLDLLICSYEDLIAMKSAGGRDRDEIDLAELRRIRDADS
ncbi:MAG: nucleotidyl transferase AbiEii/AbiGii toxin family protein [Solirubrobacterales bacterium]